MRTNAAGVALVKDFETLQLRAYQCPAGKWTIGYGHTGPEVRPGQVISPSTAASLLEEDLRRFERAVDRAVAGASSNQFAAMVSLCFNIGAANFAGSSVVRLHNAGDHAGAAEAFLMWNKATGADGKKRPLKGLTRRRAAEATLYMTPEAAEEAVDPQRTRAADVETAPPATAPISAGGLATAGAVGTAALAGQQAVSQVSAVWTWLSDSGLEPRLVLGFFSIAVVGILGWTVWRLALARRARA